MTTEFAFGIQEIRLTPEGTATITVSMGWERFVMPNPTLDPLVGSSALTVEEAQAVAAVLELVTVEQYERSPLRGRAMAFGLMFAVVQHLAFARQVKAMIEHAAEHGATPDLGALAAITGEVAG